MGNDISGACYYKYMKIKINSYDDFDTSQILILPIFLGECLYKFKNIFLYLEMDNTTTIERYDKN